MSFCFVRRHIGFFHSSLQFGFTLIELMVVFSIMTILSAVGIAGYLAYGHSQAVDTSIKDLKAALFTARSRALSQERDSTCFSNGFTGQGYELKGYQVVLCCSFPLCSAQSCTSGSDKYELQSIYGYSDGTGTSYQTCSGKKFTDPNIQVDSSSKTTATYFFFASITGAVTTNAMSSQIPQVAITGYGISKIATVSAAGVVQ